MELKRKPVQVTDVERAKVMVEGIVQQCIIDGEIERLFSSLGAECRCRAIHSPL
jgi:hypothetical protein